MEDKLSKQEILNKLLCIEFNINNILKNTIQQDALALAILKQSDEHIKQIIHSFKDNY